MVNDIKGDTVRRHATISALVFVLAATVAMGQGVTQRSSSEDPNGPPLWYLDGEGVRLGVESSTGRIRSLVFTRAQRDLFTDFRPKSGRYIGGLRIYDELADRWYDDRKDTFDVLDVTRGTNEIRVKRQYKGAPFVVEMMLRMESDVLHWEVEATKTAPSVADRSLRVHFLFPLIDGWRIWAPCKYGEQVFDGMTPFEFMYVQVSGVSEQDIILPMVSHFDRRLDVGYSMIVPIDAKVPAAKLVFSNADSAYNAGSMHEFAQRAPVLEGVNYYIGLTGQRPMRTKVMIMFHDGAWRPALGKVYRRWQSYFDPYNPAIYDREGAFYCGSVFSSDQTEVLVKMGLKTLEVHAHFEEYSDYFNAGKDRWYPIWVKERIYRRLSRQQGGSATPADVEAFIERSNEAQIAEAARIRDPNALYLTRDEIRRRLNVLTDAGVACHWYFNYSDGYWPRVERDWPDAICKDEDGQYMPSGWRMCHNMNPDPRWSFGRFCLESAAKIVDAYPMLTGFFLDCFRHFEIDFAHDDGITVVNHKAAYSVNFAYDEIERRMKEEILGPKNMTTFANKPVTIRSMRYCDGQLLEGDGDIAELKYFWGSIASPMFYMWGDRSRSPDEFLRRCVLYGAYPTLVRPNEERIALYQRYLPLLAQFKRRVFCFEPDPMETPRHSMGMLFTVADGYIAGVINENLLEGDQITYGQTPRLRFRVQRPIAKVGMMVPGDTALRDIPFLVQDGAIEVLLKGYTDCCVVKLFVTDDEAAEATSLGSQ